DRTGRCFDSVDFIAANPIVREQYAACVASCEPVHSLEPFYRRDSGTAYDVERLLLPLSSDDATVDVILVYFHFKSGVFAAWESPAGGGRRSALVCAGGAASGGGRGSSCAARPVGRRRATPWRSSEASREAPGRQARRCRQAACRGS